MAAWGGSVRCAGSVDWGRKQYQPQASTPPHCGRVPSVSRRCPRWFFLRWGLREWHSRTVSYFEPCRVRRMSGQSLSVWLRSRFRSPELSEERCRISATSWDRCGQAFCRPWPATRGEPLRGAAVELSIGNSVPAGWMDTSRPRFGSAEGGPSPHLATLSVLAVDQHLSSLGHLSHISWRRTVVHHLSGHTGSQAGLSEGLTRLRVLAERRPSDVAVLAIVGDQACRAHRGAGSGGQATYCGVFSAQRSW